MRHRSCASAGVPRRCAARASRESGTGACAHPRASRRRTADRERLKQAAEQLLTSEGWRRSVRLGSRAGLARLSLSNQLLIALAKPDATFVVGFKAWLQLGYSVRKGEKAIRMIAKQSDIASDAVTFSSR
jgi:antirestriction factor ArdC-like protein